MKQGFSLARPDLQLWESIHLRQEIVKQMFAGSLPLNEALAAKQRNHQDKWTAFFERYDVLLAPVAPTVAFSHDHKQPFEYRRLPVNGKKVPMSDNLTWTTMAIVAGLPATAAPVGMSESGLPVGIQIIGAQFEDRTTIDFARGLSELVGGFIVPPGYEH